MNLSFTDKTEGFVLGAYVDVEVNSELIDEFLTEEPDDDIIINKNDEIVYLNHFFAGDSPIGGVAELINVIKNYDIKNHYTVAELNLFGVVFTEVLEAVKKHYELTYNTKKTPQVVLV
ncbi:hypothetical protein [Candidatus Magnetomonas plexicatena]|uniref:hypothetical protein n=1 Tax=Candidatus Magnetomonas plexicatena TaxID=2552947 RepID=UPI001C76AA7F|nr:hypothetical protein E2O03_010600 [Nitrospirales bacterium LBB_01]